MSFKYQNYLEFKITLFQTSLAAKKLTTYYMHAR